MTKDPAGRTGGTVVWYESDLRMADHPALSGAVARGGPVIPIFVWDGGAGWADGLASRWWLHHSLVDLGSALRRHGLDLAIHRGDPVRLLPEFARAMGADHVTWTARPEPDRAARDRRVTEALRRSGLEVTVEPGSLLHDPDQVRTTSGGPYQVFTAFHRRLEENPVLRTPLPVPNIPDGSGIRPSPGSLLPADLDLLPASGETAGFAEAWHPGEDGAHRLLETFVDEVAAGYSETRDLPGVTGTSRLSPHLHFGEITPAQIHHRLTLAHGEDPSATAFLRQLAWREFAFHLLHHFPDTPWRPLRPAFDTFPWRDDPEALERWKAGLTGYPIVDAGMRELRHTGWMHNRVRMVAASFLTRHLLVSWTEGAAWFRERLVDADLANNTLGWQWTAGCGADAQPFFRIFNPERQGRRFDPDGRYVRRWIPELERLPTGDLHAPWAASPAILQSSGLAPDSPYRLPVVEHVEARHRALDAWQSFRDG